MTSSSPMTRRSIQRPLAATLLVGLLHTLAPASLAQASDLSTSASAHASLGLPLTIDVIADALASGDFQTRETMTMRLMQDASVSQAELLELCLTTDSPEVRRRALAAHRARFFASPRPAIGVTFAAAGGLPMIERIHDGFPAAADGTLQNGDIIVAVAGMTLNPMPSLARDELRPLIFSHEPYDRVRLTVYRPQNEHAQARLLGELGPIGAQQFNTVTLTECPEGYDTIETDVQLGEYGMLETTLPFSDVDRARAWDALLRRSGFRTELAQVFRDSSTPRNVAFHGRAIQSLDIRFPFFTAGSSFPADEQPPGFRNQAVVAKQLQVMAIQRVQVQPPDLVAGRPVRGITVESVRIDDRHATGRAAAVEADFIARTARDLAAAQARIAELRAVAAQPGTTASERQAVEQAIAELREQVVVLRTLLEDATAS